MEKEAVKDGSRGAIFSAISVLVSYFLPVPVEVKLAIVILITAGLTYVDSQIHRSDSKFNGILPW